LPLKKFLEQELSGCLPIHVLDCVSQTVTTESAFRLWGCSCSASVTDAKSGARRVSLCARDQSRSGCLAKLIATNIIEAIATLFADRASGRRQRGGR
jgi:hypothetical protein